MSLRPINPDEPVTSIFDIGVLCTIPIKIPAK